MSKFVTRAPGKLNLSLHLGPTRKDGLHELASLFESVSLHDTLTLETIEGDRDEVVCPAIEGENLVESTLRAARRTELLEGPAVRVTIYKQIPVAAGMGGGSANAAAALRLIASHMDLILTETTEIAFELGADVPSQLTPGLAVVTGAGENVEHVRRDPLIEAGVAFVIIAQEQGLATVDVFREADRAKFGRPSLAIETAQLKEVTRGGVTAETLLGMIHNDLTAAIVSLRPALAEIPLMLRKMNPLAFEFTGSGPTAFAVFESLAEAESAAATLNERDWTAHAAIPVDSSFAKIETVGANK